MKLEQKVVSLEIAKQLKEAGFPQVAEKWWSWWGKGMGWRVGVISAFPETYTAAPDVSELLEDLPLKVMLLKRTSTYLAKINGSNQHHFNEDNPANALALLWLKINKKQDVS